MNCCDEYGNCRQGRDCPIRVARVGKRYSKYPEPLCAPIANQHLRVLAKWLLLAVLVWVAALPLAYLILRA